MHDMTTSQPFAAAGLGDIDLGALGRTLKERRRLVALVTGLGCLLSAGIAWSQPNVYTATTAVLPIELSNDRIVPEMSSGGLGALISKAGIGRDGTVSDKLVALFKSRTVTNNVLDRHHLLVAVLGREVKPGQEMAAYQEAYRRLDGQVTAKSDVLSGFIRISAQHRNPEVAATLANAYVQELSDYLQQTSLTSTRRKRDFLEGKVKAVSQEVTRIEQQLVSFHEENNLIALDNQTQALVQTYMGLKSQLMTKEMELALQADSASPGDIQLVGLRQEVLSIKHSLQTMERGTPGEQLALKELPRLSVRLSEIQRNLSVKQKVYELLTQQLELAKVEEAKEALSFQVIDPAIPPDRPSGPRRTFTLLVGAIASLLAGVLIALMLRPTGLPSRYDA